MSCAHEAFDARIAVARIADDTTGEIRNYMAEVSVTCKGCGLPFHFIGPPAGLSFSHPTVNAGATTLHAPIATGEAEMPRSLRFEVA